MSENPTTPLCSDTTKREKCFYSKMAIKNVKITELFHAYEGNANTYSVDIFNSFNAKLQLKNT